MQKTYHYLIPLVNGQGRETHILDEKVSQTNLPELGIIIPLCNDLMIYDKTAIDLVLHELQHHIAKFKKQHFKKRMPELVNLLNAFQDLSNKTINCGTHHCIIPQFYFEIPETISQEAQIELAKRRISNGLGKLIKLVPGTKNEYTIDYEKVRAIKKPPLIINALYEDLGITSAMLIYIIAREVQDEMKDLKMVDPRQSMPEVVALLKAFKALSKKNIVEDNVTIIIPEFNFVIANEILEAAEDEIKRRTRLTIEIQRVPTFLTKIKGKKFQYKLNLDILENHKYTGDKIIAKLCEDLKINDRETIQLIVFILKSHIKAYNIKNHLRNKPELFELLDTFKELSDTIISDELECEIYEIQLPKFSFKIPEKLLHEVNYEFIRRSNEKFAANGISENFLIPISNKNSNHTHAFNVSTLVNYSGAKIIMRLCEDLKICPFEIVHSIICKLKSEIDAYQKRKSSIKNTPELVILLNVFRGFSNKVITYYAKDANKKFTIPKFSFEIPPDLLQEAELEIERRKIQKNLGTLLMPIPGLENLYLLSKNVRNFDSGDIVIENICKTVGITNQKDIDLIVLILETPIKLYNSRAYGEDVPELISLISAFKELSWKDITYQGKQGLNCKIRTPAFSFEIPQKLLDKAQEVLKLRSNPYSETSILGKFLVPIQGQINQYQLQPRIAKINIIAESIITILSKELELTNNTSIDIIISNLGPEMHAHDAKVFGQRAPELVDLLNAFKGLSERAISIQRARYSDTFLMPEFSFEIHNEILQEVEIEIQRRKEVETKLRDLDSLLKLFNRNPDDFQQEALRRIIDPTEEQKEAIFKLHKTLNELVNENKEISHEKSEMLKENSVFIKFFEEIYSLLPKSSEIDVAENWIQKINSEVESSCDKSPDNPAIS